MLRVIGLALRVVGFSLTTVVAWGIGIFLMGPVIMFWRGPEPGMYYIGHPFSLSAGIIFHALALLAIFFVWTGTTSLYRTFVRTTHVLNTLQLN